jgi:hypothetical protein
VAGPLFRVAQDSSGDQVVATVGSLPVSGRRRVATPAARGGQIWPFDGRLEGARGLAAAAWDGGRWRLRAA